MKKLCTLLLLTSASFADQGEVSALDQSNQKNPHFKPVPKKNVEESRFHQGDDVLPSTAADGYNTPARIKIEGKNNKRIPDLAVDVAFIYYYIQQEGLNLANSGQIVNPSGTTNLVTSTVSNGKLLTQDFEYSPGFRVGIGANYQDWFFSGEYTWIRQSVSTSANAPSPRPTVTGDGVWITNNWFEQANPISGQELAGTSMSSKWHIGMDLADFTAARPYYEGRNLTVNPFFGVRAAWIRQTMKVNLQTSALLMQAPASRITSNNSSNCWGIGPRTGFGASYILPRGWRLMGDAAVSLLYTAYTHVNHYENGAFSAAPSTVSVRQGNTQTVRPEMDLGVSVGWGSYLRKERYHLNLVAGYDFIVFWGQNMIRNVMDETITGVAGSPNNLYLQGLNLTARVDF